MSTEPLSLTRSHANAPSPAEVLWQVEKDGRSYSCELRYPGEGIEARILRDGTERLTRRFQLRDLAILWAAIEKEEL